MTSNVKDPRQRRYVFPALLLRWQRQHNSIKVSIFCVRSRKAAWLSFIAQHRRVLTEAAGASASLLYFLGSSPRSKLDLMPSACYTMSSHLLWNQIALHGPVEVDESRFAYLFSNMETEWKRCADAWVMSLIVALVETIWERACLRPLNISPPSGQPSCVFLTQTIPLEISQPLLILLKNTDWATVSLRLLLWRMTKKLWVKLFSNFVAAARLQKQHPGIMFCKSWTIVQLIRDASEMCCMDIRAEGERKVWLMAGALTGCQGPGG